MAQKVSKIDWWLYHSQPVIFTFGIIRKRKNACNVCGNATKVSPEVCVHKTYDVPPNNEANVEIEQLTQEIPYIDQNVIPSVTLQPIHEEENCDGDTDSFHSCTHVFICFYQF